MLYKICDCDEEAISYSINSEIENIFLFPQQNTDMFVEQSKLIVLKKGNGILYFLDMLNLSVFDDLVETLASGCGAGSSCGGCSEFNYYNLYNYSLKRSISLIYG